MDIQKLIESAKKHWQIVVGAGAALLVIVGFFAFSSLTKSPDSSQMPEMATSTAETDSDDWTPNNKKNKKTKSTSESSPDSASVSSGQSSTIVVDVKGAVKKPSIYKVDAHLRINDLIQMAGGFTDNADQKSINLAAKISDAQVIYVPTTDENAAPVTTEGQAVSEATGTAAGNSSSADKVNINTADLSKLQTLSGIGQKKAQDIIDYRTQNGPLKSVDELGSVSGFGAKTVEKLKESITVD